MKIVVFTETMLPEINGVAASSSLLVEELRRLGHDVRAVTNSNPQAPKDETGVYRIPSIMFNFLQGRRVGTLYSRTVSKMMSEFKPDIIHTQTEFSVGLIGKAAAKRLNIPFVHTYHTLYKDYMHYLHLKNSNTVAQKFVSSASRSFCNAATAVIVPSEKTGDVLLGYGVTSPIRNIPTGLKLAKLDPAAIPEEETTALRASLGISPDEKILLYLGRIAKEKNIDTIIRAMPEILRRDGGIRLLIVGGGTYLDYLKKCAAELGVTGSIIFAGAVPFEDVGKYYRLGNVFISASSSETQGMTYFEALCAGLPIVVRRDECLKDVLLEGKNGWAFDSDEQIAELVTRVFEDGELRRLTRENVGYVPDKYFADTFARSVYGVYKEAVSLYAANPKENGN